jgi:uridine kinase
MEQYKKTRELLINHYKQYPKMEIQDMLKYIFQSSFGCEHMVSSEGFAIDYIKKEYASTVKGDNPLTDALDGEYSRVSLSYLDKEGLSAETLGRLFYLSAKKETQGKENLEKKLLTLKELVNDGALPFSTYETEKIINEWADSGYPAIHHSDAFRNEYHPAYRVIDNKYVGLLPLLAEIDKRLNKGSVIMAIEGGSASGKSTLADTLQSIYGCNVFHTDDFFLRPEQRTPERLNEVGGNLDRERFLDEVLIPLREGKDVNYRKFNCTSMKIEDEITFEPSKLTVVEGAYSMHPELREYYDSSVFLDVDSKVQRERILQRNSGSMAQRFFDEWIPLEEVYFSEMNIKEHCNMVIHFNEKD